MATHFIKTEISSLEDLAALAVVHPNASALLAVFKALVANDENIYGGVMVSNNILQRLTSTSKPTVVKSTRVLVEGGFIGVGKCGKNNVYIINRDVLSMVSDYTDKAYEKFTFTAMDNVRILLDDDESAEITASIKMMRGAGTDDFKQIRSSSKMNSRSVKHSVNMKGSRGE